MVPRILLFYYIPYIVICARKMKSVLGFLLLYLALKFQDGWCGVVEPVLEWKVGSQEFGPSAATKYQDGASLCANVSISGSSFLLWAMALLDWMIPKIFFSALILFELHEADAFTFWFLL